MKMDRKFNKIKKIIGEEENLVILTDEAALVNGNTFEIIMKIQRVLSSIIEESGFPKDKAKEIIDVVFMDEDELEKELERQHEKLKNNLEELKKKLEKETKKNK